MADEVKKKKSTEEVNILSAFRDELGYACVTNQYIEMAVRLAEREHKVQIDSDLQSLARSVGLAVSSLSEDYRLRICKGYIINVHTSLEKFLNNFKALPGSPANVCERRRGENESKLEWTLHAVYGTMIPDDVMKDYRICDYYRLVRNIIVHPGKEGSDVKTALYKINNQKGKLNAPNEINSLDFDDQVLFSRAALSLAKTIYNDSNYDIECIVEHEKNQLKKLVQPFKEPKAQKRAAESVRKYIEMRYCQMSNCDWESIVRRLQK